MKIVVGIDAEGEYHAALEWLKAFDTQAVEVQLVYAVESVMPDGGFPLFNPTNPAFDLVEELKKAGETVLGEAAETLESWGISCSTKLVYGDPAHVLSEEAPKEGLILVGGEQKGFWSSLIGGNVAKGLSISADNPFLVGKDKPRDAKNLVAVFATDHSEYAHRCARQLKELAIPGVKDLSVVHVVEPAQPVSVGFSPEQIPIEAAYVGEDVNSAEMVNKTIAQDLSSAYPQVHSKLIEGDANESLAEFMKESGADLLILGAQGHSFFDRILLGSTTVHMVVNEAFNVLVLRPNS